MEQKHLPTDKLEQWSAFLKSRNLLGFASVLLSFATIWGYVGGQVLWMLTPFVGESRLKDVAEMMENPEALKELRDYLVR